MGYKHRVQGVQLYYKSNCLSRQTGNPCTPKKGGRFCCRSSKNRNYNTSINTSFGGVEGKKKHDIVDREVGYRSCLKYFSFVAQHISLLDIVLRGVHEMVKGCMLVKVLSGFYFDREYFIFQFTVVRNDKVDFYIVAVLFFAVMCVEYNLCPFAVSIWAMIFS